MLYKIEGTEHNTLPKAKSLRSRTAAKRKRAKRAMGKKSSKNWTLMRFKFLLQNVLIGKKSPKHKQFCQI